MGLIGANVSDCQKAYGFLLDLSRGVWLNAIMKFEPNEHEIEVLEMLNGEREGTWGAWVAACLEFLSGAGLCTRGPNYKITNEGREFLAARSR